MPIKGPHQRLQGHQLLPPLLHHSSLPSPSFSSSPLHYYLLPTSPITTTTCNIIVPSYYLLVCICLSLPKSCFSSATPWYQSPASGLCCCRMFFVSGRDLPTTTVPVTLPTLCTCTTLFNYIMLCECVIFMTCFL